MRVLLTLSGQMLDNVMDSLRTYLNLLISILLDILQIFLRLNVPLMENAIAGRFEVCLEQSTFGIHWGCECKKFGTLFIVLII
jgi:hypothetical protein